MGVGGELIRGDLKSDSSIRGDSSVRANFNFKGGPKTMDETMVIDKALHCQETFK